MHLIINLTKPGNQLQFNTSVREEKHEEIQVCACVIAKLKLPQLSIWCNKVEVSWQASCVCVKLWLYADHFIARGRVKKTKNIAIGITMIKKKKRKQQQLTAQLGEVKPSTAACRPSATKGTMFSPKRVSRYRALKIFKAWTWWHVHKLSV